MDKPVLKFKYTTTYRDAKGNLCIKAVRRKREDTTAVQTFTQERRNTRKYNEDT